MADKTRHLQPAQHIEEQRVRRDFEAMVAEWQIKRVLSYNGR